MKKHFFVCILAIICALAVCGCSLFGPKNIEFTVYRIPADGSETLIAEKIQKQDNGQLPAKIVLDHLINVKSADDRATDIGVIPDGTQLLSVEVKDGVCYANFSHEMNDRNMGSYNATMLIGSIVNTLTEMQDIHEVQILIEGKKKSLFAGVLDIEEPLLRNESLLKKPKSN